MSDSKVYGGGIPQGGFDAEQSGAGFDTVKEAEFGGVYGGPATLPKTVKEGGNTEGKTAKNADSFHDDAGYRTNLEAGRPSSSKTVNPDDLSTEDHC